MFKTLTKHGNSMALVIDKPILELIGATSDSEFQITTNGRSLILRPVTREANEKDFREAVAFVHENYGNAMKKLAE